MTKATAAVMRAVTAPFTIEELTLDEPRAGEVLVRVVAVGMCHTDVVIREMPPEMFGGPMVYGHEGAGVVERVGPGVTRFQPGDHVVMSFRSCTSCKSCIDQHPAYCSSIMALNAMGRRDDGSSAFTDTAGAEVVSHFFGQSSFASRVVADARSLVKVDAAHDLSVLAPLGCGIQTGAGAVFNFFKLKPGESIAIIGAGAVGLSALMAAKVAKAGHIVAVDRHQSRLDLANRFGATAAFSASPDAMTEALLQACPTGFDYVLDTTGIPSILRAGFNALNYWGTLGICGVGAGEVSFDMAALQSGRVIKTVFLGDSNPETFIPYLADLNARGEFPYHELIKTFPFSEINAAEQASKSGEVVKPVLVF
jgi:aryl-alcohol dehydrogenase